VHLVKPRILLIGSSGFIGQHLTKNLGDSYEIWHINRHSKPTAHSLAVDLLDPGSIEFIRKQIPDIHFQSILYLTNISSRNVPPGSTIEEANILALTNLLGGLTIKADKFGFFSSVYVYKNPECFKKLTEDSPVEPTSPYGKLKAAMENQIIEWGNNRNLPISIFRPEWVYGTGDITKKVIPELCRAAVSQIPYLVKINPNETRQPIFISDLVNSINSWMGLNVSGPNTVFLLVGQKPVNQLELLEIARQNSTFIGNPVVELVTNSSHELNFSFDYSKTCEKLRWRPEISVENGMVSLINFLRKENS
jgi:nucleoside-diphosphate-sugar epimerase